MYYGHGYQNVDGDINKLPVVKLDTIEDCIDYIMIQKKHCVEVVIEDENGDCIFHAEDGTIVFPEEYKEV